MSEKFLVDILQIFGWLLKKPTYTHAFVGFYSEALNKKQGKEVKI